MRQTLAAYEVPQEVVLPVAEDDAVLRRRLREGRCGGGGRGGFLFRHLWGEVIVKRTPSQIGQEPKIEVPPSPGGGTSRQKIRTEGLTPESLTSRCEFLRTVKWIAR